MKKLIITFVSLFMLPLIAQAADVNQIDDFKNVFGESNISIDYSTNTITLLNDAAMTGSTNILSGTYIIDYNNKIVDIKKCNQYIFKIDGSTVTFKNANFDFSQRSLNQNFLILDGTLNIDGGKYINSDQGLFISHATNESQFVEVNVYGGTFNARRVFDMKDTSYNHHTKLNIYKGDFSGSVNENTYSIIDTYGVDVTIGEKNASNDDIYVHSNKSQLLTSYSGDVVINSGTFYVENGISFGMNITDYLRDVNHPCRFEMNGGVININKYSNNSAIVSISGYDEILIDNALIGPSTPVGMSLSINAKKIDITNSTIGVNSNIQASILNTSDTSYKKTNFTAKNSTQINKNIAKIDNITTTDFYISFDGDVYIDNVYAEEPNIYGENVYLDKNDFAHPFISSSNNITVNGGSYSDFYVTNCQGKVIINDGEFIGSPYDDALILDNCKYEINGGTFNGDNIIRSSLEGVINGGTFNGNTLFSDNGVNLTINDGTFKINDGLLLFDDYMDLTEPTKDSVRALYKEYGYEDDYIDENIDDIFQDEYDYYLMMLDLYNDLINTDYTTKDEYYIDLKVNGGKFDILNDAIILNTNYIDTRFIFNGGTFNVDGKLLDINSVGNYLSISGGTFISSDSNLITTNEMGYAKITGGNFKANDNALIAKNTKNVHISGGTFTAEDTKGQGILVKNDSAYNLLDLGYGYLEDNIIYTKDKDTYTKNDVTVDKFYVNAIINLKGNGSSSKDLVQKNMPAGTDYENIITADHGKKITSIKVDGKEILTKDDLKTNITKYNFNYKLYLDRNIDVKLEQIVYDVIEGDNQTFDNISDLKYIRINSEYSNFKNGKIFIDNIEISKEDYSSKEGSTMIKLSSNFLKKLNEGKHKMFVIFDDGGIANASFTVTNAIIPNGGNNNGGNNISPKPSNNPKTGVEINRKLVSASKILLIISVMDFSLLYVINKKTRKIV